MSFTIRHGFFDRHLKAHPWAELEIILLKRLEDLSSFLSYLHSLIRAGITSTKMSNTTTIQDEMGLLRKQTHEPFDRDLVYFIKLHPKTMGETALPFICTKRKYIRWFSFTVCITSSYIDAVLRYCWQKWQNPDRSKKFSEEQREKVFRSIWLFSFPKLIWEFWRLLKGMSRTFNLYSTLWACRNPPSHSQKILEMVCVLNPTIFIGGIQHRTGTA